MGSLRLIEAGCKIGPSHSVRRRVNHIVKKLGPLRDLQVHMAILNDSTLQSNISEFRNYLSIEAKKEHRLLRRYLTTKRRKKIQARIKKALSKASQHFDKISAASLGSRLRAVIRAQGARLQNAQRKMTESDPGSLHTARILTKTLRYLLEAAEPVLGRAPRAELQRLRREQNKLGHIHDLQIAQNRYDNWTKQSHS